MPDIKSMKDPRMTIRQFFIYITVTEFDTLKINIQIKAPHKHFHVLGTVCSQRIHLEIMFPGQIENKSLGCKTFHFSTT